MVADAFLATFGVLLALTTLTAVALGCWALGTVLGHTVGQSRPAWWLRTRPAVWRNRPHRS